MLACDEIVEDLHRVRTMATTPCVRACVRAAFISGSTPPLGSSNQGPGARSKEQTCASSSGFSSWMKCPAPLIVTWRVVRAPGTSSWKRTCPPLVTGSCVDEIDSMRADQPCAAYTGYTYIDGEPPQLPGPAEAQELSCTC